MGAQKVLQEVKYALINNRDSSTSRWLLESTLKDDSEYTILSKALRRYANTLSGQSKKDFNNNISYPFNDRTKTFDQFDPGFQQITKKIAQDSSLRQVLTLLADAKANIYAREHESFTDLKRQLQNRSRYSLSMILLQAMCQGF